MLALFDWLRLMVCCLGVLGCLGLVGLDLLVLGCWFSYLDLFVVTGCLVVGLDWFWLFLWGLISSCFAV